MTMGKSELRVSNQGRRLLALVLTLYLGMALAYSVVTPLWETPDEVGHVAFVRHLRMTVMLVAHLGWEIFPKRPGIGLLGVALVAFTPQFLVISGSVNNGIPPSPSSAPNRPWFGSFDR